MEEKRLRPPEWQYPPPKRAGCTGRASHKLPYRYDVIGISKSVELNCLALLSRTGRPLGLFFFILKGAVGSAPEALVRSRAAEGGPTEELKTCLREYRLPQRGINGRNRVPKAAFDHTGQYSLGNIRRIC